MTEQSCQFMVDRTEELVAWTEKQQDNFADDFRAAQEIVKRLGAHYKDELVEFGFWAPELAGEDLTEREIYLEVLTPQEEIDFESESEEVVFKRDLLPVKQSGEYLWSVAKNVRLGNRKEAGAFYWVKYKEADEWNYIVDYVAYSVPFGAFAPSEVYDMDSLQAEREDKEYFQSLKEEEKGPTKIERPTNILQIHPGTASKEGTLRGLTEIYQTISTKLASGEELKAAEKNFIGYDGVQLMPIEPTIEYEVGDSFWQVIKEGAGEIKAKLAKPDMTNWGYDILISASSAVNPAILGSGRPHEFSDFIEVLHNFSSGPIKLVLDVVFGHTDNQSIGLLADDFMAGANMYGQNLDYENPVVRAILLEMQRRKVDFGVDGVRVDGAQDFKCWDEENQELYHDDDYLQQMSDLVQEVAGVKYQPWMIFEDGRPWPRDDWELASTYRSVIDDQPDTFQWGPLTFAHNTPFLYTFWVSKWWRVKEIMDLGAEWITGCSNHDTVRRGTQVETDERINTELGDNLLEILDKAYNNPAENLLTYTVMPGVPMDFINASLHAPWSFIRNTDYKYGIKVVSEEYGFLDWQVNQSLYEQKDNFIRLKELGFNNYHLLKKFMRDLNKVVVMSDYDLEEMVKLLKTVKSKQLEFEITVENLRKLATAWMDDLNDYCNLAQYWSEQDNQLAEFNLALRKFRLARPWLRENLTAEDSYGYLHPCEGNVVYYALRHGPDKQEQILFVANMEGKGVSLSLEDLPIADLELDGWEITLKSPKLDEVDLKGFELKNSQAVVLTKKTNNC